MPPCKILALYLVWFRSCGLLKVLGQLLVQISIYFEPFHFVTL